MIRGDAARLSVAAAGLVAMSLGLRDASAHRVLGGRTVVVQLERGAIALLVSWKPPGGDLADALAGAGARGPHPRDRMRALYAERALAPLRVTVDGKPLAPASVEAKLVLDPPGSGRLTGLVLVRFTLPAGARAVSIDNRDARQTRLALADRSGGRFAIAPSLPARRWSTSVASLLLTSRPGRPGNDQE